MKIIKDPGTKLDLLINNLLTSVPVSRGLSPSNSLIVKESEGELGLKKQFRIQHQAESVLSSVGSARMPLQRSMFEVGKCVACTKCISADLFTCKSALQVVALEHAKMKY